VAFGRGTFPVFWGMFPTEVAPLADDVRTEIDAFVADRMDAVFGDDDRFHQMPALAAERATRRFLCRRVAAHLRPIGILSAAQLIRIVGVLRDITERFLFALYALALGRFGAILARPSCAHPRWP